MARTTTRSHRQLSQSQRLPTQSQPQALKSQPQRRRGRGDDEDEEEDEDEEAQDENVEMDGAGDANKELERKANDLVRLALFTEHRRIPLRREEISKKVLGSSTRAFNAVCIRAQEILHKVLGMELVELQAHPEEDKDPNEKDAELLKGTGLKKRAAPTGTKTYILRSVLAPTIIERACAPDAEIRAAEQAERAEADAEGESDDDDNRVGKHSTGSIFSWHHADQLGSIGILYVILALILIEGKVIGDNELHAILKRLRLPGSTPVPLSSQSTRQDLSIDTYLTQLTRQGYLDRARAGEPKGKGKRGRASAATQGEDANNWEWRWGPRARAEVGERAVARFIAEFMAARAGAEESDGDGGSEEGGATEDAGAKKRTEIVLRAIERAAGMALTDVGA